MSGRYLDEFEVGQVFTTASRTITETDIVLFTGLSGDFNPLHTDEVFAKGTVFGTRIAQGLLGTSIASGLVSQTGLLKGTAVGFLGIEWKFTGPLIAGDTITVVQTVTECRPSRSQPDRGVLVRKIEVINQAGKVVQVGSMSVLVLRTPDERNKP